MAGLYRSRKGKIAILATSLLVVLAVVAAVLLLPAREVSGQVVDGTTGQPLAGAVVKVADRELPVGSDGSFNLTGIRFGTTVLVEAWGYQPTAERVALGNRMRLLLTPRVLEGLVRDELSGKPVANVQFAAGPLVVRSDQEGRMRLVGIEPGVQVVTTAEGYGIETTKYVGQSSLEQLLKPNVLAVTAVNRYTGQPLEGAEVSDGRSSALTDKQGQARLQYLRDGAEVSIKLAGFAPAKVAFSRQGTSQVALRPDTVAGTVKDPRGRPVAGALVSDGNSTANTDANGAFVLSGVPEGVKLSVSANGYLRQQMELGQRTSVDVVLKPFAARGLYLTYYGVGDDGLRGHVLDLADKTEVNAVVIDIKGDRGWIAYKSNVPMVEAIDAQQEIMIPDPKKFLADLRRRGVYTIARLVVFKDNPLATTRPDLAVINAGTGRPWIDNEGLAWADPTREEVWDYNIALAVEAIENGFDEVQFDYVRFPTDAGAGNSLDSIRFSRANNMANRVAAISGFLEKAKRAIHAKGGIVSADIFGYVVWREDDMGIGQNLEELAKHVDYVSPMVYPNLFWHGIVVDGEGKYTDQQAGLYPYEIVYESMKIAARRIGPEKLRPWLQYYNDYLTGKSYGAAEVEVQKKATYDNGITGWMFWDPSNRFAKGGFEPE